MRRGFWRLWERETIVEGDAHVGHWVDDDCVWRRAADQGRAEVDRLGLENQQLQLECNDLAERLRNAELELAHLKKTSPRKPARPIVRPDLPRGWRRG